MRRCRPALFLVAVMMLGVQSLALCQTKPRASPSAPAALSGARRITLKIGGGFGIPVTRDGIKEFWGGGGMLSLGFLFAVNPTFSVGFGWEGALLPFDETAFAAAHPSVPVHDQNVGLLQLFMETKYTPFWKYRLAPYLSGTLGGARLTNAEYFEYIGGKRVTYYQIRGITRLAVGVALGTDLILTRSVGLWAEVKATYVHHDPDIGFWASLRGGVRFAV